MARNRKKKNNKPKRIDRYGINRNDEGYPDPTFAQAWRNISRRERQLRSSR